MVEETQKQFKVLVNDEGQHSLFPAHKDSPAGWNDTLFRGTREQCLAYVEANWTDITPISARPQG